MSPKKREAIMKPQVVYINGRFLSQRVSGVQRFARELVSALDVQLAKSTSGGSSVKWVLLTPQNVTAELPLVNIEIRRAGWATGHFWDQLIFPLIARDGFAVSLANNGALLHGRSMAVLHDAMVFRTPDNYSLPYRLFHQTLDRLLAMRSAISTVSKFSRHELAEILHLDPAEIFIIPNGCNHLKGIEPDNDILTRLSLTRAQYFLFVGSLSPSKNLRRTLEAFATLKNKNIRLVIVGAKASIYGDGLRETPSGVTTTGFLSDREIVALYRNALALIFPSLYEGFGIPPLEAMVHGCPVLASNIPPVREVCGNAAIYFDPFDVEDIARVMSIAADALPPFPPAEEDMMIPCSQYNWSESARNLQAAVESLVTRNDHKVSRIRQV